MVEVVSRIGHDSGPRARNQRKSDRGEKWGYIYIGKERNSSHRLFRIDVHFGSMSNYVEKSLEPVTQVAH